MALFCPLQNVTLLIVEEFALRTGVHIPWPQLERLADEIARSVERKVRHTHERFFAEENRTRRTRGGDDGDLEISPEDLERILEELAEETDEDDRAETRRGRGETVARGGRDDADEEAARSRELPRQAA